MKQNLKDALKQSLVIMIIPVVMGVICGFVMLGHQRTKELNVELKKTVAESLIIMYENGYIDACKENNVDVEKTGIKEKIKKLRKQNNIKEKIK